MKVAILVILKRSNNEGLVEEFARFCPLDDDTVLPINTVITRRHRGLGDNVRMTVKEHHFSLDANSLLLVSELADEVTSKHQEYLEEEWLSQDEIRKFLNCR